MKTYRGMVYLDIREYFRRDKESWYIPTKKGITLSMNEYRAALTMLYKSIDKAIQTGLQSMDYRRVQSERGEQLPPKVIQLIIKLARTST